MNALLSTWVDESELTTEGMLGVLETALGDLAARQWEATQLPVSPEIRAYAEQLNCDIAVLRSEHRAILGWERFPERTGRYTLDTRTVHDLFRTTEGRIAIGVANSRNRRNA